MGERLRGVALVDDVDRLVGGLHDSDIAIGGEAVMMTGLLTESNGLGLEAFAALGECGHYEEDNVPLLDLVLVGFHGWNKIR